MQKFYRFMSRLFWVVLCLSLFSFKNEKLPTTAKQNPLEEKEKTQSGELEQTGSWKAVQTEMQQMSTKVNTFKSAQQEKQKQLLVQQQQTEALHKLQKISGPELQVIWDPNNQIPIFIDNVQTAAVFKTTPGLAQDEIWAQRARFFLSENAALLRIENAEDEFKMMGIEADALGMAHVRYQQIYKGLDIWGSDVIVHIGADGIVHSFNGRSIPTIRFFSTDAAITAEEARDKALIAFNAPANVKFSKKMIYHTGTEARLVWQIRLQRGLSRDMSYFIDAGSGEVLKKYSHVNYDGPADGSGTDVLGQTRTLKVYETGGSYFMIDPSKSMYDAVASQLPQDGRGVIYTLDAKNADSTLYFVTSANANDWNNQPAVSAAANGALVFDYYKQVHNRNAIDGKGTSMNLVVNFSQNYNNAFWNGSLMVFGNGDGQAFSDLSGALDVTAHEMTHGVVEHTANLVYENQSGALNESFADVFGTLFEFWVKGDQGNWLLGEDVTTPNIDNDCLRSMAEPDGANIAFQGQQPAHMDDYNDLPNTPDGDNGGVHVNSGIPNKAFYLFAQSTSRDDAEKVYYRALSTYLTRSAQFIDARIAVVKSAEDLFGAGSAQAIAAAQAFDAVGVADGQGTPPPVDNPAVVGAEYLAVTDAGNGQLYRVPLDISSFLPISNAALKRRPAPEDDGGYIYYVDTNSNIHVTASDGTSDQALTDTGVWEFVAISPSGQYLAATSIYAEAAIYIFDFGDLSGNSDKRIELFTPTYTEGEQAGNILYPDRLDWSSDSQYLMYDALNAFVNSYGDTTEYWDINIVRPTDVAIARLFPPQPPGVNIGNPVFSSNNDNKIVFDYIDADYQVSVLAADLNTGNVGIVANNFNSLGNPSFSNDDSRIYYHYVNGSSASIWYADLQQDGLSGDGLDKEIITGGMNVVDFAIGTRPSGVAERAEEMPADFQLFQNYPNPFNPATMIRFSLPQRSNVTVKIFDLMGRELAVLTDKVYAAGSHELRWSGEDKDGNSLPSGLYFYKLMASSGSGIQFTQTRKMTLIK